MKKSIFTLPALAAAICLCMLAAACSTGANDPQTGGKTLASIAVTTQPTKAQYNLNEDLDTAGMVVTATYSDNSTAAVTGYATTGYDKTKTGSQTVTVTYQGKTAAFTVTVIDSAKETAAAPTATPQAGTYTEAQTVTLSTATPGATIHYTMDGSTPLASSGIYTSPLPIPHSLTIKAIAVKDGMNNSATLTAVYTITTAQINSPPNITNAGTDLTANTGVLTADGLTVNLTGTAADPEGDTLSYQWQCTGYDHGTYVVTGAGSVADGINSGIGGASGNGTAAVTLRKAGTYTFKLSVSDSVNSAVESEPVVVTVAPYTATKNVDVAAVPFTAGTELKLKLDSNNYSFTGGTADGFAAADLNGITYTLSSTNPVKDLSDCSNGNIPSSKYAVNDYPTITQTFSYNGEVVGQRKIVVQVGGLGFENLYEYKPTNFDGELYDTDFVDIFAVPATTLTLSKTITEVLPPPDAVVSFVSLAASFPAVTIDFSPSAALPAGVTYTLTDDRPTPNIWNSANGFTGVVNASTYSGNYDVTFVQTFYLNGTKITGSNSARIVEIGVATSSGVRFASLLSDSGSVTLWYNP